MKISESFFLILIMTASLAVSQTTELSGIKAVVNGEPITSMEVESAIQSQIGSYIMQNKGRVTKPEIEAEIRKMQTSALEDLIERRLILSKFKELGGAIKDHIVTEAIDKFVKDRFDGDQDKFLAELEKSGMTFQQFRKVRSEQIAVQALRGRHSQGPSGSEIFITPQELEAGYAKYKNEYADDPKIKLRMLSISKDGPSSSEGQQEKLIKDIRSQLVKGSSSFAELAKTHSGDSFAAKGGSVGLIDRNVLNEKITTFVFKLPTGEVSSVFNDGTQWRLFKIDSRVGGKAPPFEALKDQIQKRLIAEKRRDNFERWINQLRRDANIRIY